MRIQRLFAQNLDGETQSDFLKRSPQANERLKRIGTFAVKNCFSKNSYIKFTMKKYPEHNSINLALKKSTLVENTFETVFTRN